MSFLIKGFLALFWLFPVPTAIGFLFVHKKQIHTIADCYLCGMLFLFAWAELLILPFIAWKASLTTLTWIFASVILLACAAGLFVLKKNHHRYSFHPMLWIRSLSPLFWCALVLIAVQLVIVTLYAHFDADDAFYLATAVTSVETDSIFAYNPYTGAAYGTLPRRYILSPFPIFLAALSRMCGGLHPAILAHTVCPPVFLIFTYTVLYQLGKSWFSDSHRRGAFLFFVAMLSSVSYYSDYNAGVFQMIRLWQGKALLAAALLPLLFYLCHHIAMKETNSYPWIVLLMANLSCCLVSSMGIILAPVLQGIFIILSFLRFRSLKRSAAVLLGTLPSLLLGALYMTL